MLTGSSLPKRYRKTQRRLNDRVSAYLKEQSPDHVHDLRTTTRRLLTLIELLPKSVRTAKRFRKYSERTQKLISLNARVRDLDIIIARAAARQNDPEYAKFAKKLENSRKSALKPAREFAASFEDTKQPTLHGKDVSNIDPRKRFNKIARRLSSRISKRLSIVLEDASNKRELHRLREDARMLRYMIELAEGEKSSKVLPILTSWQETLGLIHDSDIVIDYLQNEKGTPEVMDLIRDEHAERNKNYEVFASMAAKSAAMLSK